MKKHLFTLLFLTASVFAAARLQKAAEGPDQEFRCHLAEIRCDACRSEVTTELKNESGIRAVRFEGEDRKDLVVTHASSRSRESLKQSLKRLGYPLETPEGGTAKPVSSDNCACPVERAKAGYLK
jgi:copper chaperone CopZ